MVIAPPAQAQSRSCEVCLTVREAEALRKKALRGEGYDTQRKIASQAEAEKNKLAGQVTESRAQGNALRKVNIEIIRKNERLTVELENRPTWADVALGIGGGLLVGGGIGILITVL